MIIYAKAVNGGEVEHFRHIPPPSPPLEWEGSPGEDFIEVLSWPPAERPNPYCSLFIQDGLTYWHDARDINKIRIEKNQEINAARLKVNRGTFTFNNKQIACDELSRSDIDAVNGVVALLGAVPISQWKAVDNTYVQIPDKATWINFYLAMVQTGQANFDKAQNLKATLALATTIEEVSQIKWS